MQAGKFITLEGIEGVGKSTNLRFIADYLQRQGLTVTLTREPGGTPLAEDLRKILLADYSEPTYPETELLILYAGRLQHIENVIKPALKSGHWVVCDRFNDATFAYQGAGRNVSMEKIRWLDQWTLNGFQPELTIILDAPVEIALERIKPHRVLDRFEKEQVDFFERIRECYLNRANANPERYRVVNAAQKMEDVQDSIAEILAQCCGAG